MKALSVSATIVSIGLVICAITFAWSLVKPIDVIDDETWTLTYDKPSYTVGDKATLISRFTKLVDVKGEATRYIICKSPEKVDVKYKLNADDAIAPKGKAGVGIIVTIPKEISNVKLPTDCRFYIVTDYRVTAFRSHKESTSSSQFTLYPKVESSSTSSATVQNDDGSSTTTKTDTSVNTTSPSTSGSNTQTNTPTQKAPEPTTPPEATQTPQPITGISIVDDLLHGLGL